MNSCPSCSADNPETGSFCSACGAALKPEHAATFLQIDVGGGSDDNSSLSSFSESSQHGRFLPGTKIAERYRIVSLVGKGGMGEVYRADDLKLGHTVALKFLPRDLAEDPQRLEFFHNEVRLTRQISHPNVCRVYDIGEVDGQHFLSMEYVDGEDLKILLQRIGRLPRDKGVEIAQQLCAGLAAAHEVGVLHRDLKPANIMLDGRGRVRITDFGLAKPAEDATEGEIVGTPAYMAPEQMRIGRTTIQSDLYSLGLILYELFTGEAVHKGGTMRELLLAHEESSLSHPSSLVDDMDPAVERVILRCLEKEPHERPQSAHAVAAALPGADPLAAALAAGETPSPEMVAAAGERTGLNPRVAAGLLVGVAVGLLCACFLAESTNLANRSGLQDEPAVLAARVRELVEEDLGYSERPFDVVHGFHRTDDGSLRFWYRQRQVGIPLDSVTFSTDPGTISRARPDFRFPPWEWPEELGVQLAPDGKLRYFRARPPWSAADDATTADPSQLPWAEWFPPKRTGFHLPTSETDSPSDKRTATAPVLTIVHDQSRTPPDAFDALRVWKGTDDQSGEPFYVEAAAFRGKPVYFEVFSASQFENEWALQSGDNADRQTGLKIDSVLLFLALIGAIVMAWHNLRSGRGDRRGAMRLACVVFFAGVVISLTQLRFISIREQPSVLTVRIAMALLHAGLPWLFYIGFEPLVRRIWPQMLISWTRLLDGRLRDPVVGRDLLVGVLAGTGSAICFQLSQLAHVWLVDRQASMPWFEMQTLAGSKELLGSALELHLAATHLCATLLLQLLVFRILLRSKQRAIAAWFVVFTVLLILFTGSNFAIGFLPIGLHVALSLLMLVRFGFLALIAQLTVMFLAQRFPLTLDASHWYFSHGVFIVVWIAAIATYGFYTSLGGRSVFSTAGEKAA